MLKRLTILLLGSILVISCRESFNVVYEELEEFDPHVTSPEIVDTRAINILPTLSDPLYTIDIPGPSSRGAFGDYAEDKEHWLSTRFHTFGLRTSNINGGGANYVEAQKGNKDYAVLWNQSMGIFDQQGHTRFFNKDGNVITCQYDTLPALYRYKFFMLGMDGKETEFRAESNNRVLARVKLDGNNDILHSFAYHTEDQYTNAIQQLPTDEATKIFLGGGKDYLYNRLSGYCGIHPIFNVNHLMCRFDVYVKGARSEETPGYDFMKILITDVALKAHENVDIVVADDKWEKSSYEEDFLANKLTEPIGEPSMCSMPLHIKKMQNTEFSQQQHPKLNIDTLLYMADTLGQLIGQQIIPDKYHWVSETKRDTLCETFMMAPLPTERGQFALRFKYRYLFTHTDSNTGLLHLGINANSKKPEFIWEDVTTNILIPNYDTSGAPVKYQGGKRYSVILTVHGKSVVKIEVIQAALWEDGGDIDVEMPQ